MPAGILSSLPFFRYCQIYLILILGQKPAFLNSIYNDILLILILQNCIINPKFQNMKQKLLIQIENCLQST